MARNRTLWNIIALVAGIGTAILPGYFGINNENLFVAIVLSVLLCGFIIGFFAYKNDGFKIAGILTGTIVILGILFGILLLTGASDLFNTGDSLADLFGGLLAVAFGIILIVAAIIGGIGMMIGVAIGSLIGRAIWQDEKKELGTTGSNYAPMQSATTYQPVTKYQPTEKQLKCEHCGTNNKATESFCNNCGAQLKAAK